MDNNYLYAGARIRVLENALVGQERLEKLLACESVDACAAPVSYTHLRAHETD